MKTFSRVAIAGLTMMAVGGVASAQQPKAPAPAPKADKAPEKMAMPPVPPELDALAKQTVGTWKCKGDEWDSTSGAKGAMTATNTAKLDLDKWWLVETMEVKGMMTLKMVSYTTYDATAKKWRRVGVMNGGAYSIGTSDGMKDGKMTWNLDMMTPMGAAMFRDMVDMTDAKAGMKAWGEMSMDKGKTWKKVYEMTCKK